MPARRFHVVCGDVMRYSRGSKALGIEAGDYPRVEQVGAKTNHVSRSEQMTSAE